MDESPSSGKSDSVVLLGLGYTTTRLAKRLLVRGLSVYAVVRNIERFRSLEAAGVRISTKPPHNATIVHTIPPLPEEETSALRQTILDLSPRRVVYISATSVYGGQTDVSAGTAVQASDEKSRRRIDEEKWIAFGPWSSLIVRPAAIYGPGRGVHVRVREGRLPRGSGVVSRIHVDDLAAILEAAVLSESGGAWPLADDHPCRSEEISEWCTGLLRMPLGPKSLEPFPVAGRNVDGTGIRRLLGVRLAYPGYQSGILASLAEEIRPERTRARGNPPDFEEYP